jgi:hypothetical protein
MVCVSFPDPLWRMHSTRSVAEFREGIHAAVPGIVECLEDSQRDVRFAAISRLSALGAHGLYQRPRPIVALNPFCS